MRYPKTGRGFFSRRHQSLLSPLALGIAVWVGFPATIARQDVTSFVTDIQNGEARWSMVLERSVAGSTHAAEMPFSADPIMTGSISGAGIRARGVGDVAFRGKGNVRPDTPDESRINRAEKRGRLVKVAPVAPPKAFNAGSVVERTSSLLRPGLESGLEMAFVKPKLNDRAIRIASTFFNKKEKRPDPAMPAMLARLVNNDRPDILATAYAPREPDYASVSPFASLLKGTTDDAGGRFIPPIGEGDHGWARRPLPVVAFSPEEQKCLAAGIYFEARGEPVEGQAAVAQVILNRVRAPSYPNTICGVVYQNDNWRNRCQFSFACDGRTDRVRSPRHWEMAKDVALAVSSGKIWLEHVGSSTHYHATYVSPRWARTMKRMEKIGRHIFYRTYGGGWS